MFRGIVGEVDRVQAVEVPAKGVRLRMEAGHVLEDLSPSNSVAVSGVCLTAVEIYGSGFWVDVSRETLGRTTLVEARVATRVNLERALRHCAEARQVFERRWPIFGFSPGVRLRRRPC